MLLQEDAFFFYSGNDNSLMKSYKIRINGAKTRRSFFREPKLGLRKEIKVIK